MASYSMGDLKKGLKIEIDGVPYKIVEYQHVKPGKGAAFVRAKIKSFVDGKVLEKTFHAGDKCEQPHLEEKEMQYLEDVGDVKKWMIDGMMVEILFHNGNAIGVEVPQVVELKIVETPPNFKGDTQGGKKPATLESGAVVQIPFHVLEGEVIRVDTVRGEYIERANK